MRRINLNNENNGGLTNACIRWDFTGEVVAKLASGLESRSKP